MCHLKMNCSKSAKTKAKPLEHILDGLVKFICCQININSYQQKTSEKNCDLRKKIEIKS